MRCIQSVDGTTTAYNRLHAHTVIVQTHISTEQCSLVGSNENAACTCALLPLQAIFSYSLL